MCVRARTYADKESGIEHKDRKKKVGGRDIGMPEKGGKSGARVAREPKG